MKRKYVPVRLPEDLLERVKKMAGSRGLSVSETVGILIAISLESDSGSGLNSVTEVVRKEVVSAIQASLEPISKTLILVKAELSGLPDSIKFALPGKPDHSGIGDSGRNGTEICLEVIRFIAEKAARINALLNGLSAKDLGSHLDRTKQAEAQALAEIKKLFGG